MFERTVKIVEKVEGGVECGGSRRELEEKLRTRIISVCMSLKVFFFLNIKEKEEAGLIIVDID